MVSASFIVGSFVDGARTGSVETGYFISQKVSDDIFNERIAMMRCRTLNAHCKHFVFNYITIHTICLCRHNNIILAVLHCVTQSKSAVDDNFARLKKKTTCNTINAAGPRSGH